MNDDLKWRSGPPPHVGWWNASIKKRPNLWRWWNGSHWSMFASESYNNEGAAISAAWIFFSTLEIKWRSYYPKNARVPRIDPRKP